MPDSFDKEEELASPDGGDGVGKDALSPVEEGDDEEDGIGSIDCWRKCLLCCSSVVERHDRRDEPKEESVASVNNANIQSVAVTTKAVRSWRGTPPDAASFVGDVGEVGGAAMLRGAKDANRTAPLRLGRGRHWSILYWRLYEEAWL